MFSNKDLTRLLVPLVIEQLLAVTIGMADTVMVSAVSEAAVSGVSLVDAVNMLLLQVFAALGAGGAIVAAQYLGREDVESACHAAKQLFLVVTGLSAVIMAVCLGINGPLLELLYHGVEPAVMENARVYFYLTALSYPFIALYSAGAALFRAQNRAKVAMFASLLMNLINISGNALLIYGFGLGTAGAGIATLVSRVAGAVFVLWLACNPANRVHLVDLRHWALNGRMCKRILGLGIPSGLENGMFHVGKILVSGLVASFGTAAISANAVCNSVGSIPNIAGNAISLAMITVIGQCVGAGDYAQARRYVFKLMSVCYLLVSAVCLLLWWGAPFLTGFFSLSAETMALSIDILRVMCVFNALIWPLSFTLPNALRAAGDVRYTMLTSIGSMWIFRIGFSYVLGQYLGLGVRGVWFAMYVDWFFRAAAFLWRFLSGKWKRYAVV